jgi:hypothetical protein
VSYFDVDRAQLLTRLFSFIFTLQEFARELVSLIDAMERVYSIEQERLSRVGWLKQFFLNGTRNLKFCGFWLDLAHDKHERRRLQRSLCT